MIEQTNDPEQWEDFWSTPHATEAPFLEAPHSHGCALTSRGGACDCALADVVPCTCAWPGSRCEHPHKVQATERPTKFLLGLHQPQSREPDYSALHDAVYADEDDE